MDTPLTLLAYQENQLRGIVADVPVQARLFEERAEHLQVAVHRLGGQAGSNPGLFELLDVVGLDLVEVGAGPFHLNTRLPVAVV